MVDIYILDDQLRRIEIVGNFESLVWKERYNDIGDFELVIDPRIAESQLAVPGTALAISGSDRVMTISTITGVVDNEGKRSLKVEGYSIESWLKQRVNQNGFNAGAAVVEITKTGTPGDIIRNLVSTLAQNNTNFPTDNIPFLQAGTISNLTGAIAEPTTSITYRKKMASLFDTIKELADAWDLGFRIVRVADDSKLYFEVYAGFDRTSGQTARPAVIFSSELDNLANTSELNSNALQKTVAYVCHGTKTRIVYADGYDVNSATGVDRKVLIVDASDITVSGVDLDAAMDLRGRIELAQNRYIMGFDGEIPQTNQYIYNTHYRLGDLIEQQSDTGYKRVLRVTEQIITSNKEGESSYPTLTFNTLITPGSWYAIPGSQEWYDYISTVYWNSM